MFFIVTVNQHIKNIAVSPKKTVTHSKKMRNLRNLRNLAKIAETTQTSQNRHFAVLHTRKENQHHAYL